ELIVMRLHAEQHAALAAGHIAAELVDVVAAGFLDALNRVRDTFTNLGLRRDAGGRPYHCQQGSGEDGSPRGGDHGWFPFSRLVWFGFWKGSGPLRRQPPALWCGVQL